jgi:two-component system response regulator HydG
VRDLKHFVQRAFILAEEELGTESLGAAEPPRVDPERVEVRVGSTLAAAEKQIIKATMRQFEGDKRAVAQVLGISIKTLYTRLGLYAAAESGCP